MVKAKGRYLPHIRIVPILTDVPRREFSDPHPSTAAHIVPLLTDVPFREFTGRHKNTARKVVRGAETTVQLFLYPQGVPGFGQGPGTYYKP